MDFDFTKKALHPATLKTSHKLIDELWSHCMELKAKISKLEEKANTDSSNSSLPPSSDSVKRKAELRKERDEWRKQTAVYWKRRRIGAQPGHKGVGRALVSIEDVDEIISCHPSLMCDACSGSVKLENICQRKQIFDLPTGKLQITEFQIYNGRCMRCKKRCRGQLPQGTPRGILGTHTLAKIATLTGKYRLSKREVKEFLFDFFGLKICIGTVSNAEHIVSHSLRGAVEEIGDAIPAQSHLHADETGHNHRGNLEWLWVATNEQLTYFKIYQHRNQTCAKALVGENFSGMMITDRYGAYNFLPRMHRQYCWAHLKRDFKRIADSCDVKEADIGDRLLTNFTTIFCHWRNSRDGMSKSHEIFCMRNAIKRFYDNLRSGRKLVGTKAAKFCGKLIRERKSLWHFLDDEKISPTNNHAERQLRHAVIWRKKCYGTQSKRGIVFVERILTVIKTCQQKKVGLIKFINQSIQSRWHNLPAPSLVH